MPVMSSVTSERSLSPPRSSATMPSIAISTFSGRAKFAGLGIELEQPLARVDLAGFRELHAHDPEIAPCDAAAANSGVENACTHAPPYASNPRADHNTATKRASGIFAVG